MNEEMKKKRDEVLKRFLAARDKKREHLIEMEERMRRNYKLRTGMDATNCSALWTRCPCSGSTHTHHTRQEW